MSDHPVVIRADAGPRTGAGHAMRCVGLAQALAERGCPSVFLVPPSPSWITDRLQSEGFVVVNNPDTPGSEEDAERTTSAAEERGASWIVLDGYRFDGAFQSKVTATGIPTAAINDNGELDSYLVDVVVNQNLHACASFYERRRADTQLLLGPRYALLRREFLAVRPASVSPQRGSRVLVALGGGAQDSAIKLVTEALARIDDPSLKVQVVGDGEILADPRIVFTGPVTNMPERMRWADLAIASAGSVCWELAYMGVPAITLTIADNQEAVATSLHRGGIAVSMGAPPQASAEALSDAISELLAAPQRRSAMAAAGRKVVDGLGAGRVADALLEAESA